MKDAPSNYMDQTFGGGLITDPTEIKSQQNDGKKKKKTVDDSGLALLKGGLD